MADVAAHGDDLALEAVTVDDRVLDGERRFVVVNARQVQRRFNALRETGCTVAQGFYLKRQGPAVLGSSSTPPISG